MTVTINEKEKTVTITLPLNTNPSASKSGKSLLVATTRGNINSGVQFKGKPLVVSVNAYIHAD